jgi:energy-coupling factor transporter transmembrane protein EcfT
MSNFSFPSWYEESESLTPKIRRGGKLLEKNAEKFLKTISHLSNRIDTSLVSEIDIRIKSLLILIAVIFITFAKSFYSLFFAFLFSLIPYFFSKNAIKKIYPFFLGSLVFFFFVAPIATTEFITKGEVIFKIFKVGITKEGIITVSRLFLRSFSTLFLVLLLASTTPLSRLSGDMPFPSSLKVIFTIMHLNIRKMLVFSYDSYLSRISRSPIFLGSNSNRKYIGFFLSKLFKNSLKTSEEIHFALVSRGWQRKLPPKAPLKFGLKEFVFTAFFISFYLFMVFAFK